MIRPSFPTGGGLAEIPDPLEVEDVEATNVDADVVTTARVQTDSTPLASTGSYRLANANLISWRNNANNNNMTLGVSTNAQDFLLYNGNPVLTATSGPTAYNLVLSSPNITDASIEGVGISGSISVGYNDESGTPGDCTINAMSGIVAIPMSAGSVTVTNSFASLTSRIFLQLETVDSSLTRVTVSKGTGVFSIVGNFAAADGDVLVSFWMVN